MTINIETVEDYITYGYEMTVHCAKCNRRKDVDLSKLPPTMSMVAARFRCEQCGRVGDKSVTPAGVKEYRRG